MVVYIPLDRSGPIETEMLGKKRWVVFGDAVDAMDLSALDSMDAVMQQSMERVTDDDRGTMSRMQLQGKSYYLKTFTGIGDRLKEIIGKSRYQVEFKNLRYLSGLGLKTPDIAAYGHVSGALFLKLGVLITCEIKGSRTLMELLDSGALYEPGAPPIGPLLQQLASAIKTLHEDGFYYRDLKTRNILITSNDREYQLYFIDCPSGFHPPAPMLSRCIIRDLAYLERGLRDKLRVADMLYLFKMYRGVKALSVEDKALAESVLTYYRDRRQTSIRRRRERERLEEESRE